MTRWLALALLTGCVRGEAAWLEETYGDRALGFATAHRQAVEAQLGVLAEPIEHRLIAIDGSEGFIRRPTFHNGMVRTLWTDEAHPRGLWRETSLAEYAKPNPTWTTLLDIDALNARENTSQVFQGAECLPPTYTRCLVALSFGGSDLARRREFDTTTKAFVEGGFDFSGEAAAWKDENTLTIGMSERGGWPHTSREWKRGTPPESAPIFFGDPNAETHASCTRQWEADGSVHDVCRIDLEYDRAETYLVQAGTPTKLAVPDDANVMIAGDHILVRLASDWAPYRAGSLLAMKLDAFQKRTGCFQVLFAPTEHTALHKVVTTKSHIVVISLHDVRAEVTVFARTDARWVGASMPIDTGAIDIRPFEPTSDEVFVEREDFLVPKTLERWNLATGARDVLKREPAFFDAPPLASTQHFAVSKDGTKVPYFEIGPKARTGPTPTILQGYGGFGRSMTPGYLPHMGPVWLEKGGTFVVANLRGGGEYGPAWHHAATRRDRQRAFDDMAAVAEDLVRRGVTTPKQLGITGTSNGGLLTSVMLTQRPELFGAVVSRAPLTDMRGFPRFFGASAYRAEYGDPDNADDWASMQTWSPLENIRPGQPYPPMFFLASTKDDRVHPAHARKAVAALERSGYAPLYFESYEGGHFGAVDFTQAAHVDALVFAFFARTLGLH